MFVLPFNGVGILLGWVFTVGDHHLQCLGPAALISFLQGYCIGDSMVRVVMCLHSSDRISTCNILLFSYMNK